MPEALDTLFVGSSELARLMRTTDWSQTPVGVPATWPASVCAIIRMMLTSRYAMWMGWGPDLTFFYNDAYARMTLGVKHPWALGKPASRVWAEIWPTIGSRIEHVLATGDATWDEGLQLFLERSGFPEETYHTFSYSPLHQDDGQIAGMFCVVTEETTRVIGERHLGLLHGLGSSLASCQTTEEVWSAVQQVLTNDSRDLPFSLVYLFDADDDTASLVAQSNVDAGDPIARITIPIDDALWPLRRLRDVGAPRHMLIDLPAATGWPRGPWPLPPTRAIALPLAQPGQSRPAGAFIAGLNPYRPVEAEFESFIALFVGQLAAGLANAQAYVNERLRAEALAQIDRAKTAFFSNVSHELRTPLTLILGPVADALASDARRLDGSQLDLVHRNGLRLRKLVNGLLDFSRLESGRVEACFQPVDMGRYTAEIASAFQSLVEGAGLRFVVEHPSDTEPTYLDRELWEKIVLNLISNAFKFTLEGEIRVSVSRHDDRMVLIVRDTGLGIPAAELPRIFERFHRVEGSAGRTYEGTGIGLALVQELVRLHGGEIAVDSDLGHGSTFTVSVPLGSMHLPAARLRSPQQVSLPPALGFDAFVEEASSWSRLPANTVAGDLATPLNESTIGFDAGVRIVLADDNADMRNYLTGILSQRWTVTLAADGEEALTLAREQAPDLVVTDVMMPRLDGFGLLRELRRDQATRAIPVMMLSARAGEESRIEGFQAGADDYLVKPFSARELLARVEAQLLRARLRRIEETAARRIAAVFAKAPVAIAIMRGPDHVFEMANDAYLALVGRPVIGRAVADAFPEVVSQGIIELLEGVRATGRPYVARALPLTLNRGVNGAPEQCFLDFVYQPVADQAGATNAICAVVYEVTDLVTAREGAESANRTKDEFLAMLGHELRNPLAPILTALQLLRLRGVEGGDRERTIIERQVRHLVGLVDDLLDVSRITRGKVRLDPQPIELNAVVAKAIELASPLLEQHQHILETDVPRTGLGVMADATRLAQVVSNLLTNAAKYTLPGGRIRISSRSEGADVILSVQDSGIGIDAAMLPRVFDLFTQDHQAADRAQGGLGLGLAIVRSLVALHGGSVSARSDGLGCGSEFTVRLPRIELAAAPIEDVARRQQRASVPSSGVRVLVVDDNEDAAETLADALAAAGHTTAVAPDGPAALRAALEFRPHVALLDIGLPVMDGFELARHFRSDGVHRARTRLVAVTGYGQEHDRQRSAAAGFDDHLVKPVDIDQVNQLIQRLVESSPEDSPLD
jgi:signal transduction histidine kinase/ActR/RegA family two-component response regulator